MNNKELFWGLATFGLCLLLGGAYKLKKISDALEVVINPAVSLDTKGLKLTIAVTLKNPTGGSMLVKSPFIVFQNGGKTFASSEVANENYKIPKYGQQQLDPITIEVPYLTIATEFPELLKEYRQTGKMTATIITKTTIDDTLPYSKTQNIVLLNKGSHTN